MAARRFEIRPRHRWLRRIASGARYPALFLLVAGVPNLLFDHGGDRLPAMGGIVLIAVAGFVLFTAVEARADRTPLIIEPQGVRVYEAAVPWPSIWQLVLMPPTGAGRAGKRPAIGLRLRAGAPLPSGMDCVIYDPRAPRALHLRRSLPGGEYDDKALAAAVRTFAPPGTEFVVEDAGTTVQPPSPPTGAGRREAVATVHDVRMHDYSSTSSPNFSYRPHPVVAFTLPDRRQVIAESRRPAEGRPGQQVTVNYDPRDPGDVYVHGPRPEAVRRWTEL